MTKTGFQKFEIKLQKRVISQQQYLEVIWHPTLCPFANYEQSVLAD